MDQFVKHRLGVAKPGKIARLTGVAVYPATASTHWGNVLGTVATANAGEESSFDAALDIVDGLVLKLAKRPCLTCSF